METLANAVRLEWLCDCESIYPRIPPKGLKVHALTIHWPQCCAMGFLDWSSTMRHGSIDLGTLETLCSLSINAGVGDYCNAELVILSEMEC